MSSSRIDGFRSRSRRFDVGFVALFITTSVHVLAWLALKDSRTPESVLDNSASIPLTVRLIPFRRLEMSALSAPVMRPDKKVATQRYSDRQQNLARPKPQQESAAAHSMPPAVVSPAPQATDRSVDWQDDLNSVISSPSTRYERARPTFGASSAVAASPTNQVDAVLDHEMSKAARADCRNAHADMGLFALPALAIDTMRGTGCKW